MNRIPPHNLDAERCVLGSILLDQDCIARLADTLRAEDFYMAAHRLIYESMLALFRVRQPIDLLTLSAALETSGQLAAVGGAAALAELTETVPTASRAADYAEIVRLKATHRAVIQAGMHLMQLGYDEAADVLSEAQKITLELSNRTPTSNDFPMPRLADDFYEAYARRSDSGVVDFGIQTGIASVDALIGGFRRGDFVIVAGRASAGKTAYALHLAQHAASIGKRVLFASLEMMPIDMYHRLLSALSRVHASVVATGLPNSVQHEQLVAGLEESRRLPFTITKAFRYTVEDLRARAITHKLRYGLDILFVDYIGLIRPSIRTPSRVQEVSDISRKLAELARELEIPVVALSQLNRNVDARQDKKPFLSDLKESGSLEQDSDIVMLLNRPAYYDERADRTEFHVNIAKNRKGPTGTTVISFDESTMSFSDRMNPGLDLARFGEREAA